MGITQISVQNCGYIYCKSGFYSALDGLDEGLSYTFTQGVNKLVGDIDSGNWAVSYLLSMYKHRRKDFFLYYAPQVIVNDKPVALNELSKFSCYMDELYPLFSGRASVRELIMNGLKHNKSPYTCEEIKKIFDLDDQRFERPLKAVGNEAIRAMGAIGLAHNKEVFCFPWLSHKRFYGYHGNMTLLLERLKEMGKIAIVPVGLG